ncbi:MAG: DNA primase [Candidatus Promineifilaceae bacterium]
MTAVDEIKNRLDIVDIVSETVSLRKSGRNYSGFCPFHSNTRTPAFYVFPETQTWRCFGACAEGGDLFSFIMKRDNLEFKEALRVLAGKAGVQLEEYGRSAKKQAEGVKRLAQLMEQAVDYYHMLFMYAPEAEPARQYVQKRGLTEETITHYKLGFALNRWDAALTHFHDQGYDEHELLDVGLLIENEERGTRYDRFRNRLMIPIRDINGRWVGFGARTLDPEGIPKYLNSPQTPLFDKSNLLYGLHDARRHIRETRQVVIVEGYMDVIQAWQAGFRNVVAQMGTALTEEQLKQLKRYTKRFILALDADAAGVKATMRSLQVARETLGKEVARVDAKNMILHERQLQVDIRVVTLPEGQDPDSLIRQDASAWPKLLESARPIVQYVIEMVTQDLDLNDPKAKTAAAQQVIPLIRGIKNSLEKEHFLKMLAKALQTDMDTLDLVPLPVERERLPFQETQAAKKRGEGRGTAVSSSPVQPEKQKESYFLAQCLHHPWVIQQVNIKLAEHDQPLVSMDDFSGGDDKIIYQHLAQKSKDKAFAHVEDLWDSLDDLLMARVEQLQNIPAAPDSELDRLAEKLTRAVLDWREAKVRQLIDEIQSVSPDSRNPGDVELQQVRQQLQQWKQVLLNIHRVKDAISTSNGRR